LAPFNRRRRNRSILVAASVLLYLPVFGQATASQNVSELWDFTKFYDPTSLSHFAKPLSDGDRGQIISIVKHFTGSRGEVMITSSVTGSFTVPHQQQTLIYASQYDDRRSMADGTWSFYVLFSEGHAQVINGGTRGVRGELFLLRSITDSKTGLDKILVYSGWFGMQEDIGSAYLMSIHDLKPAVDQQLGVVYESTCGSGFSPLTTVASKLYRDGPASLGIVREHYVRQCGSSQFTFLKASTEDAGDVLSSLAAPRKNH
jgi:hypothetical protein